MGSPGWSTQAAYELKSWKQLLCIQKGFKGSSSSSSSSSSKDWRDVMASVSTNWMTSFWSCYGGYDFESTESATDYVAIQPLKRGLYIPKPTVLMMIRLSIALWTISYLIWDLVLETQYRRMDMYFFYVTNWGMIASAIVWVSTTCCSLTAMYSWYREYQLCNNNDIICNSHNNDNDNNNENETTKHGFMQKMSVYFNMPSYQLRQYWIHKNKEKKNTALQEVEEGINKIINYHPYCDDNDDNESSEILGSIFQQTTNNFPLSFTIHMYGIAMSLTFMVVMLYWTVDFPMKKNLNFDARQEYKHTVAFLLIVLVAIFEKVPVLLVTSVYLILITSFYALACCIVSYSKNVAIYSIMDWVKNPGLAVGVSLCCVFLLTPLTHILFWTLFRKKSCSIFYQKNSRHSKDQSTS